MSVESPAIPARRNWRRPALGVLLAMGFFSLPIGSWIHDSTSLANHLAYELVIWEWVAGMLVYVVRVERRPLSSIGFRALGVKDVIIAIAATGSRAVAGVVTCSVFTLDHIGFWGWHHVFIAGLAGAVLTILYLWRRSIWVNVIAHFMVDAAAFLA